MFPVTRPAALLLPEATTLLKLVGSCPSCGDLWHFSCKWVCIQKQNKLLFSILWKFLSKVVYSVVINWHFYQTVCFWIWFLRSIEWINQFIYPFPNWWVASNFQCFLLLHALLCYLWTHLLMHVCKCLLKEFDQGQDCWRGQIWSNSTRCCQIPLWGSDILCTH